MRLSVLGSDAATRRGVREVSGVDRRGSLPARTGRSQPSRFSPVELEIGTQSPWSRHSKATSPFR